ncbi:hypothetical protein [Musicola keenii]|uniref:hypothetical protein n=1 Tax=Musicola keenii TaxID=2884250 RepID=UPI00177A92F4|nr:hypothetical protein [Musicola keenii]
MTTINNRVTQQTNDNLHSASTSGTHTSAESRTALNGATHNTPSTNHEISTLALQLSAAAERAAIRDSTQGYQSLAKQAQETIEQLIGSDYDRHKKRNDSELPNTDDPDLLARAQQATDFVNRKGANPFRGLSREQLALITYDDSGTFTVNERRAAWSEAYDQEEAWRVRVCAMAMNEYNATGKTSNFFKEVLRHYQELPKMERVQYPLDYPIQLQTRIAEEESKTTSSISVHLTDSQLSELFERLLGWSLSAQQIGAITTQTTSSTH